MTWRINWGCGDIDMAQHDFGRPSNWHRPPETGGKRMPKAVGGYLFIESCLHCVSTQQFPKAWRVMGLRRGPQKDRDWKCFV